MRIFLLFLLLFSFKANAGISVWNCYRQAHYENGEFKGMESQLHMWIPFAFSSWLDMQDSAENSYDAWDSFMDFNWPGSNSSWNEQFSSEQKQLLYQWVKDGYKKPWYDSEGVITGYALEYSQQIEKSSIQLTALTRQQVQICTRPPQNLKN